MPDRKDIDALPAADGLSPSRLAPYLYAVGGCAAEAIALYVWDLTESGVIPQLPEAAHSKWRRDGSRRPPR